VESNWFDEILDIKPSKLLISTCGLSFLGGLTYGLISEESISFSIFMGVASFIGMAVFLWFVVVLAPIIIFPIAVLYPILMPYLKKFHRWLKKSLKRLLRWLQESF